MLKKRVVRDPRRETITFVLALVVIAIVFLAVMNWLVALFYPPVSSTEMQAGPLQFSLRMPKTNYREGEPVPLELTMTNTSKEAVTLRFDQGNEYDFVVQKDLNLIVLTVPMLVWTWSGSHASSQAAHRKVLDPGKSMVYKAEWPQVDSRGDAAGPGRYVILGTVNLAGKDRQTLKLRGRSDR